jgi:hypothetical protein
MRDATTKGWLAALRRKLEALASLPRWMEQARARRLANLETALESALPLEPGLAPEADGPRATRRRAANDPER